MTRESPRKTAVGGTGGTAESHLIAGLWEEATFPRLPWDAPAELEELVEEVDNPHRVYAIHQASRRHDFQLIVQMYIVQLRDGCGTSTCSTSTCLSFRQRMAGKVPLRRYRLISARTLAIHLASQPNSGAGICPALRLSRTAPNSSKSSMFLPRCPTLNRDGASSGRTARKSPLKDRPSKGIGALHVAPETAAITASLDTSAASKAQLPNSAPVRSPQRQGVSGKNTAEVKFAVSEKVSKDYRSFAANVFGTVACTMLDWLTPYTIGTVKEVTDPSEQNSDSSRQPAHGNDASNSKKPQITLADIEAAENSVLDIAFPGTHKERPEKHCAQPAVSVHNSPPTSGAFSTVPSTSASIHASSPARYQQLQTQPQNELPVENCGPDAESNLSNSQPPGGEVEAQIEDSNHIPALPLAVNPPTLAAPRPFSQLSNAGLNSGIFSNKMPLLKASLESKSNAMWASAGVSTNGGSDTSLPQSRSSSPHSISTGCSSSKSPSAADYVDSTGSDAQADASLDVRLPQTLKMLSAEVIDFICDVLQDDATQEKHMLEPPTVTPFHKQPNESDAVLKRKTKKTSRKEGIVLRQDWRTFIEQSLFYVLSDPHFLLRSFTKHEQLYDTQTLWYCMLRLTRAAPSVVLHSLWVAAKSLLVPSKTLLAHRMLASRVAEQVQQSLLTDVEVGMLLSICLHALVAVAPVVKDEAQLYDMSRIRSQGLSLAGSGLIARQPAELCLQYDEAFTNDLALRLARLLFSAIVAQRTFNAFGEDSQAGQRSIQPPPPRDILEPLFSQLDFLNFDAACVLDFSCSDRAIHETRMPTLLLDWARTVMLNEWTGSPVVPGDGHFGGALALVAAIYEKRHALLIGDVQFRSEYFAERLDDLEMPVAWLTFNSTAKERHLLDYPFIFSPTSLISYFRSINFSRMNRAFEESSSLQSRMYAIISPGSLIVNPHHRKTLQDLLKMATTKYLVLDIDRDNILQDAFDQLWRREQKELLRPLKVRLGEGRGEEGIDSGGVQHEFFRLALSRALDPNYGVFTVDGRTHMTWFNPTSLEAEWKFELIGLLVSLALFNGISLPVVFPKALYRKLLGEPVKELHHIADGWPDLVNGLTTLLEWQEADGAVEDVFVRTYEFSVEAFGQPVSRIMGNECDSWPKIRQSVLHDIEAARTGAHLSTNAARAATAPLIDGNPGDEAPMVTGENRNAYVADYIHYLTDVSVRPQYEAFARGFRKCLHPKSLKLLTPALLQSLLEGEQQIDMDELQQYTRYVGWDASHKTVRDFWSIVSKFDDAMKRKLLEFVTASDRMPVGGAKTMQFVLQRNGEEGAVGGHLPTAYTCYGIMLLPEYPSRQVLKERLAMALENSEGFGFS